MIIVCENCDTRFNLPDSRLPAEGAKVRCSRCQHRFRVQPGGQTVSAAPEDSLETKPEEEALAGEPDLENPEFLYDDDDDDETESQVFGASSALGGDGESEGGSLLCEPEALAEGEELSEPDPELLIVDAEAEPAAGPMLEAEPAEASALPFVDAAEDGGSLEFADLDPPGAAETAAATESPEPDGAPTVDPMANWDPFSDEPESSVVPPGADSTRAGAPEVERSAVAASGAQATAAVQKVREPTPPALPRNPVFTSPGVRWLAALICLAVLSGAGRMQIVRATRAAVGPQSIRAQGWTATDIQALRLRAVDDRHVLLVRGRLEADAQRRPPRVEVTLVDARGEPLGAPVPALLRRWSGRELTPRALAQLRDQGSVGPAPGRVDGFTAIVPDPPLEASRYRVTLQAGEQHLEPAP